MAVRRPSISKRRQVTIPQAAMDAAGLHEGEPLNVRVTEDGILLARAEERDPNQWWFWTPEWQAKEREADEDLAAGRFKRFLSGEEFQAELEQIDRELRALGR